GLARGELGSLVAEPPLELGLLGLERLLGARGLRELFAHILELARLRRRIVLDLPEVLVALGDRLAQVQEFLLAARALRRGVGRLARAVELGLELRDLAIELFDLAERLAVVDARLIAVGL